MRTQQISSFDDIQAAMANFARADAALASGVAKGQMPAISAALRAGANPLQAQDDSGRHLFLQAMEKPNGEELVCLLLNQSPALQRVRMLPGEMAGENSPSDGAGGNGGGRAVEVWLAGGHSMIVRAEPEDAGLLERLGKFLGDLVLWKANFPARDKDELDLLRVRGPNRRMLDGAKAGDPAAVEAAMAEGAAALATDEQGKPALSWACEHPNHATLVGTILANDPSVSLVMVDGAPCLRNTIGARMGTGGVAPYVAADPLEMGLPDGHFVCVDAVHLSPALRAHLYTLERLDQQMGELTVEMAHRGMPTQLRWPNLVDFQRLLSEQFPKSLAQIQGDGAGSGW